jgi:hypothetical protein
VSDNKGAYEVQVDTSPLFDSIGLIDLVTAATAKSISGLATGTPYFVQVRAVNYQGVAGPWSTTLQATPDIDTLASRIGADELQDGSVVDTKFAPLQWQVFNPKLHQGADAFDTFGGFNYRELGPDAAGLGGGLFIATINVSRAGVATGTAGSRMTLDLPPVRGNKMGWVYGSGVFIDNTATRTAVEFGLDDSGATADQDHMTWWVSGSTYNDDYGANPNYASHSSDALRGFIIGQT